MFTKSRNCDPIRPVCRLRWWRRIQSQPSLIPTKIARNLRKHWKKVGWNNPSWNGLPTFKAQLLPQGFQVAWGWLPAPLKTGVRCRTVGSSWKFCVAGSSFRLVGWISVYYTTNEVISILCTPLMWEVREAVPCVTLQTLNFCCQQFLIPNLPQEPDISMVVKVRMVAMGIWTLPDRHGRFLVGEHLDSPHQVAKERASAIHRNQGVLSFNKSVQLMIEQMNCTRS